MCSTASGAPPSCCRPWVASRSRLSHRYSLSTQTVSPSSKTSIRRTAQLFARRVLRVNRRCRGLIGELQSYVWDAKAALMGVEKPVKQMDQASGPTAPERVNHFPTMSSGMMPTTFCTIQLSR